MKERKTLKLMSWDKEYNVCFYLDKYSHLDNIYVGLYFLNEGSFEPYSNITVNLDNKIPEGHGYLDVNNIDQGIINWLVENAFISEPISYGFSGYCVYPLVKFNLDKIKENSIGLEDIQ